MTGPLSARDRAHIKFCRDARCVIESADPGHNCKNLDFTLDQVEKEAGDREGLTGEARRERFIAYTDAVSLVCQDCDANVTRILKDPFLPTLVEEARDHKCDPALVGKLAAFRKEQEEKWLRSGKEKAIEPITKQGG